MRTLRGREVRQFDAQCQIVRRPLAHLYDQIQQLASLAERIHAVAVQDVLAQGVQPVLESGHDPEVAASAAYRPEEIRILAVAGAQDPAIRGHNLD